MFRKLRRKIIISNMVLFGVLVLALLGMIYTLAYVRMSFQVSDSLDRAIMSARSSSFLLPDAAPTERTEPNSVIIFVDAISGEMGYISDAGYFSDEVLDKVIKKVIEKTRQGKMRAGDSYIAYDVYRFYDVVRIVIYDYSLLQSSLTGLMFILSGVYILSLIILFFISRLYADRAVNPIENAFDRQRELVANASHELKTPITVITTSLSIINANPSESVEHQKKWFSNIHTQTQRMSGLVNDMLDLAKADAAFDVDKTLTKINLTAVLQGVLLSMEAAFFDSGFEVIEQIDENLNIKGDRQNLEKLFYILIDNAVKYTPQKGKIEISLAAERRRAVFRIRNYGVSIPEDKQSKLFDRFYRAEESHTQTGAQSFGLGLTIAKSIVEGMGGSIGVESPEGEYSEFIVSLKL